MAADHTLDQMMNTLGKEIIYFIYLFTAFLYIIYLQLKHKYKKLFNTVSFY